MFLNFNEVNEHVSVNLIVEEDENMVHIYKYFSQIVGLLIIVTNLSVVVTSGLILKKAERVMYRNRKIITTNHEKSNLNLKNWGIFFCWVIDVFDMSRAHLQTYFIGMKTVQPKSTYMLLGNISLADTILGVTMVVSSLVDQSIITGARLVEHDEYSMHTLCMVIQGMRMCPAVVSILSISFIATDRYVYLIHGLYYKSWISTKRVRISIVCTWIAGILFTIPGWININNVSRCYFIDIFPTELMLTLTTICFINIAFVTTLYIIILVKAVNANNKIQKAKKNAQTASIKDKNSILYDNNTIRPQNKDKVNGIRFTVLDVQSLESVDTITVDGNKNEIYTDTNNSTSELPQNDELAQQYSNDISTSYPTLNRSMSSFTGVNQLENKSKDNKKCRAITVVILTTGSFIITWLPFMVSIVYFGYICEKINTIEQCIKSCQLIVKPLWALALLNSLINPFIYAWWHHGFITYVKSCYNKCFLKLRFNIDKNRRLS